MPLRLRKLYCRLFGHKPARAIHYRRHTVIMGKGCSRCDHGFVTSRRRLGPMPHPDYRVQVSE